jgi:excisionase family DNA binding protein
MNQTTPPPFQDRYLSLEEIAQKWGTSKMAPYRAVTSGRLPAHNFGTGRRRALWRVLLSDLLDYERRSRNEPVKN